MTTQEGFMRSASRSSVDAEPTPTTFSSSGGVLRSQINSDVGAQAAQRAASTQRHIEQAQPQWTPTAQRSTGVMRSTMTNGEVTQESLSSVTAGTAGNSELASGKFGIVASARSEGGRALAGHEITKNSLVTIEGITTRMSTAIAQGLVRVDGRTGLFVDMTDRGTAGQPQSPQEQRQALLEPDRDELQRQADAEREVKEQAGKDTVPDVEQFDEATEALLTDTINSAGSVNAQSAVQAVITTGELPDALVATLAGTMGIEGAQVTERATSIIAAFTQQANAAVGHGAADAIWDWARANQPAALKDAMTKHANQGTTAPYKALATDYYAALGDDKEGREIVKGSPDARAMGVFEDRAGKLWVNVKGVGRVEWKVAVRQGLITTRHKG